MRIGILQCGHVPEQVRTQHGDFDAMFARLFTAHDLTFETWNVVDMDFPRTPHDAEAWLVTGSRHGAYEAHPFIPPLEDFLKQIYASDRPMVGICFGHQIIAQALGGVVEKYKDGWAIGHQNYIHETLGNIALNAWHQDQVTMPPTDARTIAGNDFCTHAALVYGTKALTVQPHPELRNPIMAAYVALREGEPNYAQSLMDRAKSLADVPTDDLKIASEMAQFLLDNRPKGARS